MHARLNNKHFRKFGKIMVGTVDDGNIYLVSQCILPWHRLGGC